MNITRIFTGQQFQKFDVAGVWNNKLIGKWDINATNVDDGRPATLDLSKVQIKHQLQQTSAHLFVVLTLWRNLTKMLLFMWQ
jgi:hypothetical protein